MSEDDGNASVAPTFGTFENVGNVKHGYASLAAGGAQNVVKVQSNIPFALLATVRGSIYGRMERSSLALGVGDKSTEIHTRVFLERGEE